MAEQKFKENLCQLLVYSRFLMSSVVCVVHMHVAVRVTGVSSINHLRDSFLVGLFRPFLIIWPLGNSLQTMSVFHSQVKIRLWCYSHGHTVSHSTICTPQAGISSSLHFHSQLRNVLKRSIPQSQICLCDSHGTLTHSNKPSCSGIKNMPPFKNPRSDLWSAWELCVFCLLQCVELACSHPVLASFLLHGFFPQCSLIQGWIEERLEPRNLFGIIATIEALCARPAGKRERKRKQKCCFGVHYWKRRLHACDLHSLFSVGYITEWDWVWAFAFAFIYPWVGWKRRNLTSDFSVAT